MKTDGGPAFPSEQGETLEGTWNQTYDPGMTLRDWFAGMALNGLLSNSTMVKGFSPEHIRKQAWKEADAMLEAREVEDES